MGKMRLEAKTYIVKYRCDDCGKGIMTREDMVLMSHPPQYPHKCDACGQRRNLDESYPYTLTETA